MFYLTNQLRSLGLYGAILYLYTVALELPSLA